MEHKINDGNGEKIVPIVREMLIAIEKQGYTTRDTFNIIQSLFITVVHNLINPESYDLLFETIREKLDAENKRQAEKANNG